MSETDGMSELRRPETKRKAPRTAFKKGRSGNPGGQSKEKRAFLDRLKSDDAEEVYQAMMDLVRERNPVAVLRAWEYICSKPPSAPADLNAVKANPYGELTAQQLKKLANDAG